MKKQSLKLFAMALVLGLAAIFGSASAANAQTKMTFEAPFEFHVGKDKLAAGKYALIRMDYGKYLLKGVEGEESRIVVFDNSLSNKDQSADQRVVFNRYGETYFFRGIFERQGAEGRELFESKYEKQVRKGLQDRENQLAGEKTRPQQVSLKLAK
ncbi:MAG TPA: hypothetical protein VIL74_25360 [Pyrinomonadaceae bacterium]|jgi:hypothetical protein